MATYEITNLKKEIPEGLGTLSDLDNFQEIVEASSPYEAAQQICKLFDGMEWNHSPQPVQDKAKASFMVCEVWDAVSGNPKSISFFA